MCSSGITDSSAGCGRPHNAHPTAKINKVKDLALHQCFYPHQNFIFCQKHLEQAFSYVIFYSHPFNEMFIVNGKSHCCDDSLLTSGLHRCKQRIFKKNTNYYYAVRISISLCILSEIFIHIDYFL